MTQKHWSEVFDYRTLRLLIGLIAFLLPIVAELLATADIPSISASYYTEARDAFVGMLFIVGAFLWAYNGHSSPQKYSSKVAGIAACFIAIFPTACHLCGTENPPSSCVSCETTLVSIVHYISAGILFGVLAFFCLGPFRKNTKGKSGNKGRRAKIYFICGVLMLACIAVAAAANWLLDEAQVKVLRITYWAEFVAMMAFGIAWFTAGKWILFVDKEDAVKLFAKNEQAET